MQREQTPESSGLRFEPALVKSQWGRAEFEQTMEDSEEQGSMVCCSPWGHKESDIT